MPNNAQPPIHPLLPCADLQQTQLHYFQNRTRKPVFTFPKTEKPVLQKEPSSGNPSYQAARSGWVVMKNKGIGLRVAESGLLIDHIPSKSWGWLNNETP